MPTNLVIRERALYAETAGTAEIANDALSAQTLAGYPPSLTPQANAVPVADSNGAINAGWLKQTAYILNAINSNVRYILYAMTAADLTTMTLTANRVYYIPFLPFANVYITELAIEVTTSASGECSIGIYDTNYTTYRPSTLLGSVVGLNVNSTGVKSGNIYVTLYAGKVYWMALVSSAGIALRAVNAASLRPLLGIAPGGVNFVTHYYESGSSLPTTPSPSTYATGVVPVVFTQITYV